MQNILSMSGSYSFKCFTDKDTEDFLTENISVRHVINFKKDAGATSTADLHSLVIYLLRALSHLNSCSKEDWLNIKFDTTTIKIAHSLGSTFFDITDQQSFKNFVKAVLIYCHIPLVTLEDKFFLTKGQLEVKCTRHGKIEALSGNYRFKGKIEDRGYSEQVECKLAEAEQFGRNDSPLDRLVVVGLLKYFVYRTYRYASFFAGHKLTFDNTKFQVDYANIGTYIFNIKDLESFEYFVKTFLGFLPNQPEINQAVKIKYCTEPDEESQMNESLLVKDHAVLTKYSLVRGDVKRAQENILEEGPSCMQRLLNCLGLTP